MTILIFLIVFTLAGCGSNKASTDAAIDMAPLALDCPTYCAEIQKNCTGANLQYPNTDQCIHACPSYAVGTSNVADTAGNTLGCRINYAAAAATMAAVECPRAGPAGDLINATTLGFCSGGDACTSFCTIEIMACGSVAAPLSGNPRDAIGNPLFQYQNQNNCLTLCQADFDKRHNYSAMSVGDSLACRLNAAVTAAISVDSAKVYCAYTADFPTGQCSGTASP
ncbi:MAG TPA: hypothetical protein VHN14_13895 [Kofleriaceae bacterium]|nr:hypothetical protein [Kofleriaceae bacterium]